MALLPWRLALFLCSRGCNKDSSTSCHALPVSPLLLLLLLAAGSLLALFIVAPAQGQEQEQGLGQGQGQGQGWEWGAFPFSLTPLPSHLLPLLQLLALLVRIPAQPRLLLWLKLPALLSCQLPLAFLTPATPTLSSQLPSALLLPRMIGHLSTISVSEQPALKRPTAVGLRGVREPPLPLLPLPLLRRLLQRQRLRRRLRQEQGLEGVGGA